MVSSFICIAQGAAGVVEDGCETLGFYTDKIETCRPYVFVAARGTLMVHDTAQIQLDALEALIAPYGHVHAVHFVKSMGAQEHTHDRRLGELSQRLGFGDETWTSTPTGETGYAVAFSPETGLQVVQQVPMLVRDPGHVRREAVNKLNDWFIPAGSERAPLDLQYRDGAFTPPSVTTMSLVEMLCDTKAEMARDRRHGRSLGLIGVSLLYQCSPLAGHALPGAFKAFVESYALTDVIYERVPAWFRDPAWRAAVMAKFEALPIFTETA